MLNLLKRIIMGPHHANGFGSRHISGSGDYRQEVVGESNYQDALDAICMGKEEDGHRFRCVATLQPEPKNPYDSNAVAVKISKSKVGYLSRNDAVRFQETFRQQVTVDAIIVGGWENEDSEGSYGVKLDIDL